MFHLKGIMLRRDILSCENLLLYESDRDLRVILRIDELIRTANRFFPNNDMLPGITALWNSIPNLRMKSDALIIIDAMMKLTSKNMFLEWGNLFQKDYREAQ